MNYLAILLGDPMAPILIGVAIGVLIGLLPLIFYHCCPIKVQINL